MSNEKSLVAEARELLSAVTPWPWTTKPGTFWICDVGHTGCGVWSTAYPPLGEPFPHAEQEADAALLARAPELISALCDEVDRLTNLEAIQSHEADSDLTTIGKSLAEVQRLRALNKTQGEAIEAVDQWFTAHYTEIPCTIPIGPVTALVRAAKGSEQ